MKHYLTAKDVGDHRDPVAELRTAGRRCPCSTHDGEAAAVDATR
jgi:hypothetical protein